MARLADQVIAGGRGEDMSARGADEDEDLAATVEWWQVGFGSEADGGESRRKQFLPALQAALEDRTLTPPEPPQLEFSNGR